MRDIDPIIGIRKFREQFAAEHNYDIRAMSATLRRISEERGHITVSPPAEVCQESLPPLAELPVVSHSTVVSKVRIA